jgi:hypothetical protein
MALEAQLHRRTQGKVTRYGAFSEHVWRPLLWAAKGTTWRIK